MVHVNNRGTDKVRLDGEKGKEEGGINIRGYSRHPAV
jgi:hypothetical protein